MDWYIKHSDENENALCHYGVKGMKWGVVNEDEKSNSKSVAYKNTTQGRSKSTEGLGYNTESNRSTPSSKIKISKDQAEKAVYNAVSNTKKELDKYRSDKIGKYENLTANKAYNNYTTDVRADVVRSLSPYLESDDLVSLIKEADDEIKKSVEETGSEGYVITGDSFTKPKDYSNVIRNLLGKYFK